MTEFNDINKEERKMSFEEFRDFTYEVKKIYDSKMADAKLKIETKDQLIQQLSNQVDSQAKFINENLAEQESRLRELERKTGMDLH